jgi:antirestriction protein
MSTEQKPEQQHYEEPDQPQGESVLPGDETHDNDDERPTDDGPEREADRPEPRIWVTSLSDYNNGVLYGAWLDADRDPADVHSDIHSMLAASPTTARTGEPAEEWAIFDYEGFGQARLHENDSIELVCRIANGITEHGLQFAAYAEAMDGDEDALDAFTDAYLGHYPSVEAYAEQLVDDLGYEDLLAHAVPDSLRLYVRIDTAAMARDMQFGGDIHALAADDGSVWLFDA